MLVEELPIASIDVQSETYRISESLDSLRLEKSLCEVGQLNPVLLLPNGDKGFIPVCGFRRLQALLNIGAARAFARVLPPELATPLAAFRTALWDNLGHRELSDLEKARALHNLKHFCGVDNDILIREYLPVLGLVPHKNMLRTYLALNSVLPHLKPLLIDGRVTLASAARIAGWGRDDQFAIAGAFRSARWSASLQRQLLDLLEELAAVETGGPRGILSRPDIANALGDDALSPFQRGEKVYAILYRWKNPRLSSAEKRFLEGKESLGLPGCVRLSPEPFFETPRLRVEFEAPSPTRFRELAAAVHRASESPRFDELFEVR
jgi:hypothetical protein